MKRVLLWLLPVVDIFTLHKILKYYETLGVPVPLKHARLGLLERWIGYMPVGFVLGWLLGPLSAMAIIGIAFVTVGPFELFLMKRGTSPWRFFKGRKTGAIVKIFLLEGYNAVGYYLLGAVLAGLL